MISPVTVNPQEDAFYERAERMTMTPPNESALAAMVSEIRKLPPGCLDCEIEAILNKHSAVQQQELGEAKSKLSKLSRMIDLSQKADDEKSEAEIASSATFMEALSYTNSDILEDEIKRLKQELGAIQVGIDNEFKTGERSGDILQDFQIFIEHHNAVEARLAEMEKVLRMLLVIRKELGNPSFTPIDKSRFEHIEKLLSSTPSESVQEEKVQEYKYKVALSLWDVTFSKYQSWKVNKVPCSEYPRSIVEDYKKTSEATKHLW